MRTRKDRKHNLNGWLISIMFFFNYKEKTPLLIWERILKRQIFLNVKVSDFLVLILIN